MESVKSIEDLEEGKLVLLKNGFIAMVERIKPGSVEVVQIDNMVRHKFTTNEVLLKIESIGGWYGREKIIRL